ncbi:MAG: ribonuclease III [Gammaproteobacteria bacterium]|nr:ribonuclease III [Gammaproteobacteria bacterium]
MSTVDSLQTKLGYWFNDQSLLKQALSHKSAGKPHNERLEYLGDSILGFVIAENLYHRFPALPEGDLTKMRSALVCRPTLAGIAREIGIQHCLRMGKGEIKNETFNRDSILSDALEAVVGALCIDGGIQVVQQVLATLYQERLRTISASGLRDSKTVLQEMWQKKNLPVPEYQVVEKTGAAHNRTFTVECTLPGTDRQFRSTGKTRKQAEQIAAAQALEAISDGD